MHQFLREKSVEVFPNAKLLDLYGQTELGLISVIDSTEWCENEYCVGTPSFFCGCHYKRFAFSYGA